jgi:Putative polyhydroxyalkanoic acid system protein (PHA_gran_rgn)
VSKIRFETQSGKDFPHFKEDLTAAINQSFVAHLLKRTWVGSQMNIEAPGATGFVLYDAGRVTVEINISFPATLLRERIVQDIQRIVQIAGGRAVKIL